MQKCVFVEENCSQALVKNTENGALAAISLLNHT